MHAYKTWANEGVYTVSIARQHNEWKRRTPYPTSASTKAANEALDLMADGLDRSVQALKDLANGVTVMLVVDPQNGQASPPSAEQAHDLASNPDLVLALFQQNLARIYALPPDLGAIKTRLAYVMGSAPTASEAKLRQELAESHRNQQFLAEVLRRYVSEEALPDVAAELARLAQGD